MDDTATGGARPVSTPLSADTERYLARMRRRWGWRAIAGMAAAAVACLGPWGRFEHYTYQHAFFFGTPDVIASYAGATYGWGPRVEPLFVLELLVIGVAIFYVLRGVAGSKRDLGRAIAATVVAMGVLVGVWVRDGLIRWNLVASQGGAEKFHGATNATGYGLKLAILALIPSLIVLIALYRQGYWSKRRAENA